MRSSVAVRGKTQKYNHAESVNALFDKIGIVTSAANVDAAWLDSLHRAALKKTAGWKRSVDALLHGLTAAGHVSGVKLADLRARLALCLDSDATLSEIFYPMAGMVCMVVVTLACQAISFKWWLIAAMTAPAGALWARNRIWLQPGNSDRLSRWERPSIMVACAILVPMVTVIITLCVGISVQSLSIHQFNVDRIAFSADPHGFPFLRDFARRNFDVDVVLGDANNSWASTTMILPGASVASMSVNPGYCTLNMYRDNVLQSFKPAGKQNQVLWLQGVMMHEFGHCLDVLRDLPSFGVHAVKVHSIAPIDARGVSDVQTYLTATEQDSTKIWREALADTLAVGYWRLVAPAQASSLAASLRQRRSNSAQDDSTHATMCWIEQAMQAPAPVSEKDLFAWADHQRSVASCPISKPGKKTSVFTKLKAYFAHLTIVNNKVQ